MCNTLGGSETRTQVRSISINLNKNLSNKSGNTRNENTVNRSEHKNVDSGILEHKHFQTVKNNKTLQNDK